MMQIPTATSHDYSPPARSRLERAADSRGCLRASLQLQGKHSDYFKPGRTRGVSLVPLSVLSATLNAAKGLMCRAPRSFPFAALRAAATARRRGRAGGALLVLRNWQQKLCICRTVRLMRVLQLDICPSIYYN